MEKILSVNNLTVRLKTDKTIILNKVSFGLCSGDVLAVDGLNGSGKTTLLNIIIGETADYIVESGRVVYYPFSEKNLLEANEKEILAFRSAIGYVPQKDYYEGLNKVTIEDLINDATVDSGLERETAMESFHHYFSSSKRITIRSIPGKLSGGEQRMVSIFLGLVCRQKTKLMIIDEPLNNLDFENVIKVSDLINDIRLSNKEAAFLMVTHCKVITCINRQRKIKDGIIEESDSVYECHHCMGEPDCNLFYLKNKPNAK